MANRKTKNGAGSGCPWPWPRDSLSIYLNHRTANRARTAIAKREMAETAEDCAKYEELLAEGLRYASRAAFREAMDWRRAARALCEAIALRPDEPMAYFNLGSVLSGSGRAAESAQRFLEAMGRFPVGSEPWAKATSSAFDMLTEKECGEAATPEWWDDEGLKALSVRVVEAAPNYVKANKMRAVVLDGSSVVAWEVGPRSSAELKEAAAHYEQVSKS